MLLISRTFRKSQITGTISFLLFSSIANSNVDGKSSLIIGGSHLAKTIGFGGNLSGRNIASVGTRMWPFFPILGSSRAPFRPFATNSSPDELGLTNDLLNHILCTLENTDICNRKICNGIERLCRSGNVSAITKLLQFSHEKHIFLAPDAYNILLAATSEWQDVELSLVIFKELLVSSKGMSSKSYFNLAKAFAITDDHSLLLNFVREIAQLTSHCGALVLNRMIFAFAECRQIEKALEIYDHMKVLECKPDLVTYNTVIGLLGRAGLVDDMLREFASMKKAKIIPDIVTYNTLLNHLQKMGRLDLCLLYMREVDENGLIPDLRTYTALIESFGRSGKIEEALRLFSAMKSRQVRPSIYIYRSLICNLKKMGMLSAAASLLDEMNLSLTNLVGPKNFNRKNG